MKVYNASDINGRETGEVILSLSKSEAREIVELAEFCTYILPSGSEVNKRANRTLIRRGKRLYAKLKNSVLCF